MARFGGSSGWAGLAALWHRARPCDASLPRLIAAAGALWAASPAAVQAAPDPCTGVGTVTCSGNQSAGVENPPAETTVLNVNSLTRDIAPTSASGQPGILFFGAGDITLNSATGPFRIVTSGDFVDAIVAATDGGIKLTSSGDIAIKGIAANGINALSFGAGAIDVTSSSNISLANGGNGILATSVGTVTVTSSGAISVSGDGVGISASAGNHVTVNSSGRISVSGDGDAIDAFDIGGTNGVGGVTVISTAALSLAGNNAVGINASSNDTDAVSVASSGTISLTNGGNAILAFGLGAVAVSSSGNISVAGSLGGAGITAASGGDGAVSITSSGGISIQGNGAAIAAGSGGAGTVIVTSSGGISIQGNGAAIAAVSGGAAANVNSSGNILLGGSGVGINAIGMTGARVSSSGTISIGGGGNAISAISADGAANVNSSGSISIGGAGAAIGAFAGGAASVNSSGNIFVGGSGDGIDAEGKVVQIASSGSIALAKGGTGITAKGADGVTVGSSGGISIGGSGSAIDASSAGGAAGVTSSGKLFVAGTGAGISAQGTSVNIASSGDIGVAKGGTGILARGTDTVSLASSGGISVTGDGSGIDARANSVTVNSSGNITVAPRTLGIGIDASSSADVNGVVNIRSSGQIAIAGNGTGIRADFSFPEGDRPFSIQSLGGISVAGDGNGIDAVAAGPATIASSGNISVAGNGNGIRAVAEGFADLTVFSSGKISIGGAGNGISADTDHGTASVRSSSDISLAGRGSGISAGSGFADTEIDSSGRISLAGGGVGIAAGGGGGFTSVGSSGDIVIVGNGTGIDAGAFSNSIVQSSGAISISGSGTGISASSAESATVASTGRISVAGDGVGIFAQATEAAVSSSGGIAVAGTGSGISVAASRITVETSGQVTAPGKDSYGIRAASNFGISPRAPAHITIDVASGTVTGGSGSGAGVLIIGGGANTLTNFGTITTSAGLSGTAVLGQPSAIPGLPVLIGNNRIDNAGTVSGNIDLGPGRNAFNNLAGGTFNTGATVKLGAGNPLNNSGNLSPGGSGVIQTTALTGNLVQGSTGRMTVDIDPATGRSDRIDVSGSANLGGLIAPNLLNVTPTTGSSGLIVVHASGGATDNGLVLGALPAVADYKLAFPNGSDVVLQGGLNFAPAGLNANQAAIGRSINSIQLAGGSASFLPVVQAILTIPDVSSLGQAYNQLSPETYADNEIGDLYSGLRFANSLMSCKVPDGRYAFIKEGQCVWAQIGGKFLNLGATSDSLSFRESAVVIAGGAEVMLQPDWFADFALGYDNGNTSTADTLAKSQASRAHFGAAVKYNPGPFLFSAAVYGGYGWYSTDRFMNFGGFDAVATSDSRISRVGGQLRAAYLIDRESWYLEPMIDLNLTRVNLNGFAEGGGGGAGLVVGSAGETVFSASPAVEIGTQTSLQSGALLRPYAKLGLSVFSNTDFAVSAAFSGAPAGAAPFSVATGIDTLTADVAAGADLFLPDTRWVLKLAYSGRYGARVHDQGFQLKASIRF